MRRPAPVDLAGAAVALGALVALAPLWVGLVAAAVGAVAVGVIAGALLTR